VVGGQKRSNKAIFKFSETLMKYAANSFRNGEFHVPIQSETGPERGRNESEIGTQESSCASPLVLSYKTDKSWFATHCQSSMGTGCGMHFCLR
jgi:hypothetical protein